MEGSARHHSPSGLYDCMSATSNENLLFILLKLHKAEESVFQPFQILTLFYFKHHSDLFGFIFLILDIMALKISNRLGTMPKGPYRYKNPNKNLSFGTLILHKNKLMV